jgi:hypothetical protein
MSITTVWTYRETLDPTRDVVGYDVEATDGHIGTIDEASTDAGRRFLVVDTGFWIFGKKRLIPAGIVSDVDHDARKVYVSMTKDQVKNAPDFEGRANGRDDDNDYDRHSGYYSDYAF